MELCWTNVLSLLVLQIVAAQDESCPEEESFDVSLPQVPFLPPTPSLYSPPYYQPPISSAPYASFPCPYQPSLPSPPCEEYQAEAELSLPPLPDINLELGSSPKQSFFCEKSYSPPCYEKKFNNFYPLYKKPKFGIFLGKSGSLCCKKKPFCSLKQKCLAKKIKCLNKLICKLYEPSLLEKKCGKCEYPAYEGYGGCGGYGGYGGYEGYDGYEGYYPPPYYPGYY